MFAPSRHALTARQGSALLITLLTTSLLLVLVLTFVVVVRVELRKVVTHQEGLQARANARLGAELAVARLQETLGADTRVSATADLFRQGGANLHQPTLASRDGNRFWTGAWDSRSWDERNPENKRFLGWLVSGNAQNQTLVNQPPSPDNTARLVGPGSVNQAGDEIRAPRVGVGTAGAYAFWVGDEGVKARFNLDDAHRNAATREERQFRLQSAQRHAAEMLRLPGPGLSLADAGRFPLDSSEFRQRRERLLSGAQLTYLGWDESSQADFAAIQSGRFHDISLVSAGLFTNTREGGLKRDLSLAFEMPLAHFLTHDFFGSGSPLAEPMPFWPGNIAQRPQLVPVFRLEGDELRAALGGDFPEGAPQGNINQPNAQPDGTWAMYRRAFPNPPRNQPPVVRGAPWQYLRGFYRQYKEQNEDLAFYFGAGNDRNHQNGVVRGRSAYPQPQMYGLGRRYGQDVHAWTYTEDYGRQHSAANPVPNDIRNRTFSYPLGRPIFPGVAPVITRVQLVFSYRSRAVTFDNSTTPPTPTGYVLDMYLDPVVTLMNPYTVPIRTGSDVGQPLQFALDFLNLRIRTRFRNPSGGTQPIIQKLFHEILEDQTPDAMAHVRYNRETDEAMQLNLVTPANFIMQPGEVMIFSGRRQDPIDYVRTASGQRVPSGVAIDLIPGISAYLPDESGIRFLDALNLESAPRLPQEHVQVQASRQGVQNFRFQIRGVNRILQGGNWVDTDGAGFFDTNVTPFHLREDGWSGEVQINQTVITSFKRPFLVMDVYLKPADDAPSSSSGGRHPVHLSGHYNLRGATFEQGERGGFNSMLYGQSDRQDFMAGVWSPTNSFATGGSNTWLQHQGVNAFWGESNTSAGETHVPLFEIPRLPLQSLGSFQSMMLSPLGDEPGMIFGNARMPLFGVPGQKAVLQALESDRFDGLAKATPGAPGHRPARRLERTKTRPDWSYLYNEALWDGFFFSSITSGAAFSDFLDGTPLPNGTFRPWRGEWAADSLFTGSAIRREAPERAAAHLMREGSFNVNSTSVEAWRALLSSTRALSIDVENQANPRAVDGTVFSRSLLPANVENGVWTGFRNLSDAQIDLLAENIVREILVRGPFLNLADFVNRRLAPEGHASQRSGAVQAAIDETLLNSNGFNRTLRSSGRTALNNYTVWMQDKVAAHLDHPILANLPGYLTQADVLTVIGPLLSARSDTFTVRAFGEHGGARAWCEITVQRIPDYVEDSVDAWVRPEASGPVNQRFGRRFVITSFRWLGEEDV